MSLFGDGRSDERRRRVPAMEAAGAAKTSGRGASEAASRSPAGGAGSSSRNTQAARMERQTRVSDLIPKSYGLLALWFFVGAALIAGLEALYFYMPVLSAGTTDGRIAAFDLDGEGSLAVWYSSFLLQLAAAAALVVYSIRKQRADDYYARYRVWIVAALCWFVMSVDEAASLHEGFKELMTSLTGNRVFGDGSIYWVGAYGVVLGIVGIRLLMDMKECITSTVLFLLTGVCYAAAVVTQLEFLLPQSGAQGVMLEEGLEMAGNLLLLMSMAVHARYVFLAAKGEIAARSAKPKRDKAKSSKAAATAEAPKKSLFGWFRKTKIDQAHGTPAPAGRTSDLEPVSASSRVPSAAFRPTTETLESGGQGLRGGVRKIHADFSDDDDDGGRRDNRKLSKAERKNLRRQKDFERRYGLSDE
jgi:hypothetical protein